MQNEKDYSFYHEGVEYAKEAAKTIRGEKIESWERLGENIISRLAQEKKDPVFCQELLDNWKNFAVSGVLEFDKQKGEQVLRPFSDLDGKCALGILQEAGFDISNLTYVRPGEREDGSVNLDVGNQLGVVYEKTTGTTYIDHHAPGAKEITSTTEIVYKTMVGLRLLKKLEAFDRLVDFVTKIDNRQLPAEEFLNSDKTVLGLQRSIDFMNLKKYFEEYQLPSEELSLEELEKYGLKQSALKQQKIIEEAMQTLEKMEKDGKVVQTQYGSILVNENNELKVGASAAYVKHNGIINFTPGKSFAVTLRSGDFDEVDLRGKLGDKFQGKIIRGKMWIYNEVAPLKLKLEEICESIK